MVNSPSEAPHLRLYQQRHPFDIGIGKTFAIDRIDPVFPFKETARSKNLLHRFNVYPDVVLFNTPLSFDLLLLGNTRTPKTSVVQA